MRRPKRRNLSRHARLLAVKKLAKMQLPVSDWLTMEREINYGRMGLRVEEKGRKIVMTPKRMVDEEDFTMYEQWIKQGQAELAKGQTVRWADVKKQLKS